MERLYSPLFWDAMLSSSIDVATLALYAYGEERNDDLHEVSSFQVVDAK